MMLQALATMFFAAVALLGVGLIASFLRHDWDAMLAALGFSRTPAIRAPLPPRYRVRTIRRVNVVRLDFAGVQRRVAA
jgi:hypothetical protein